MRGRGRPWQPPHPAHGSQQRPPSQRCPLTTVFPSFSAIFNRKMQKLSLVSCILIRNEGKTAGKCQRSSVSRWSPPEEGRRATNQPFCVSLEDCRADVVALYDCAPSTDCSNNTRAHFRWNYTPAKQLVNALTQTCLAVTADGLVATAPCSSSRGQTWTASAGSGGNYTESTVACG